MILPKNGRLEVYSGIVQAMCEVTVVKKRDGLIHYGIRMQDKFKEGLEIGASVNIDGVCQTVVVIDEQTVFFDAIQETLEKTTIHLLEPGKWVNVERSLKYGDEIGGHLMAGHVYGMGVIKKIEHRGAEKMMTLSVPKEWIPFIVPKGFIALDGVSLTVGQVNRDGEFTIHLIPETLRKTNFGSKEEGDLVNVELDPNAQMIVRCVEHYMQEHFANI